MRGFTFQNFLEKDVYAIPFGNEYSLHTSIDHARKVGMSSGVIGKSAPEYVYGKDNAIVSCSITIKRALPKMEHVGEYTATVFFTEYTTGKNLWASKPHTMLAKVAEMHALRMACPKEMSQLYVQEEMDVEATIVQDKTKKAVKALPAKRKKIVQNGQLAGRPVQEKDKKKAIKKDPKIEKKDVKKTMPSKRTSKKDVLVCDQDDCNFEAKSKGGMTKHLSAMHLVVKHPDGGTIEITREVLPEVNISDSEIEQEKKGLSEEDKAGILAKEKKEAGL